MQENETLIEMIKKWLKENGFSWVLLSEEETTGGALLKIGTILFLFPILAIALCIHVLYFVYLGIRKVVLRDSQKPLEYQLVPMVLMSVLLAASVVGMAYGVHTAARHNNVRLVEQLDELWVYSIDISDYTSGNTILQETFYTISEAMQNYHAGKEVLRIKRQLEIDSSIDQNLRFRDADEFVLFLYTLRNQDSEMREVVNETDNMQRMEEAETYYRIEAKDSYLDGNYYQAAALAAHYFNQYIKQDEFDFSGVNNQMHILRLLSCYRWELTTHRAFAKQFNAFMNGEEESIRSLVHLDSLCDNNQSLLELSAYLKALATYNQEENIEAIKQFEQCANKTNNDLLKQYCAFMCVRAAFWQYDKYRNNSNYSFFYKTMQTNAPLVELAYFKSDINKYAELVEQIKEEES